MLTFKLALQALWIYRRRTFLSSLAITVGVSSIMLLISLAQGVRQDVTQQVQELGFNLVILLPGRLTSQNPFSLPMSIVGVSTLHESDCERLRRLPGIRHVAPIMFVTGGANRGTRWADAIILATTPDWFQIRPIHLSAGRVFTSQELDDLVCLLGSIPKAQLFADASPLNQYVNLHRKSFRVIGVTEETIHGSIFGGGGFEYAIYVPLHAMQRVTGSRQIQRIIVQTDPGVQPEKMVEQIRATVRRNHGGSEDFSVVTQQQLLQLGFQVLNLLTAMLTALTSIALIVGGIGVMNVMLMSVTERVREIGIRKTVGAKRAHIFLQFLLEALLITLLGGLWGILLAYGLCWVLDEYTVLNPVVTSQTVVLAIGVCGLVGLLFGTVPALRAASQDPVESLRHE